jgi:hypothetical protein
VRVRVWIAAALGLFGAAKLLRRRRERSGAVQAPDPAEALRAKLAEAREAAGDRDEFESGETPIDRAAEPPTVADRRREVHDAGRAAIDRMRNGA